MEPLEGASSGGIAATHSTPDQGQVFTVNTGHMAPTLYPGAQSNAGGGGTEATQDLSKSGDGVRIRDRPGDAGTSRSSSIFQGSVSIRRRGVP